MPAEEITICQQLSDSWKFSSTSAVQMKKLMITSCKNLAQQWLTSASSHQKNSVLTSLLPNLNKLLIQDEGFVFIISKRKIELFEHIRVSHLNFRLQKSTATFGSICLAQIMRHKNTNQVFQSDWTKVTVFFADEN